MEPDIIRKLRDELKETISTERQVVYLMVELRKLLEVTKKKKNYPSLLFHCDWVAHTTLDRELAREIVKAFNKEARAFNRRENLKLGEAIRVGDTDYLRLLGPTVTLSNFRN